MKKQTWMAATLAVVLAVFSSTPDWESGVLGLGVLCIKTESPNTPDWESGVLGLGVRRLRTPTHDPHGLLLYALQ